MDNLPPNPRCEDCEYFIVVISTFCIWEYINFVILKTEVKTVTIARSRVTFLLGSLWIFLRLSGVTSTWRCVILYPERQEKETKECFPLHCFGTPWVTCWSQQSLAYDQRTMWLCCVHVSEIFKWVTGWVIWVSELIFIVISSLQHKYLWACISQVSSTLPLAAIMNEDGAPWRNRFSISPGVTLLSLLFLGENFHTVPWKFGFHGNVS